MVATTLLATVIALAAIALVRGHCNGDHNNDCYMQIHAGRDARPHHHRGVNFLDTKSSSFAKVYAVPNEIGVNSSIVFESNRAEVSLVGTAMRGLHSLTLEAPSREPSPSARAGWTVRHTGYIEGDKEDTDAIWLEHHPVGGGRHTVPLKVAAEAPDNSLNIASDGNVGVGLYYPSSKLDVNGGVQGTAAYSSASDARLKTAVLPLSKSLCNVSAVASGGLRQPCLATLRQLRAVSFEWRRDEFPERELEAGRHPGYLAQEVEEVVPSVVLTSARSGFKSVRYASLVPVVGEAVREVAEAQERQSAELSALKDEVQSLRERNQALERRVEQLLGALAA